MLVELNHTSTKRLQRKETLMGWLYVSPFLIGIAVFTLVPFIMSIVAMFYKWHPEETIFEATPIGWQNFFDIFSKRGANTAEYWKSYVHTLIFAIQLPVCLILGILLALAMNRKMRGVQAFRVIYYLPGIMSIVAVTIVWQKMFEYDGIINTFLQKLNSKWKVDWLNSDLGVYLTVNFLQVWKGVGYSTLMFIAGLQSVSTDQIEAARIDGATERKVFTAITLPALFPILFYLLITGLMGALQMFNEPFILLGGYGVGNVGMTTVGFVYNQFGDGRLGMASVGAWVLAVFIFIITAVQMRLDKKMRGA